MVWSSAGPRIQDNEDPAAVKITYSKNRRAAACFKQARSRGPVQDPCSPAGSDNGLSGRIMFTLHVPLKFLFTSRKPRRVLPLRSARLVVEELERRLTPSVTVAV